ncbi:signal peptidase I [Pseudomonas aeruginosa]|uniref:signal peptidase I n=1 Tax=Pseudomonas aeruginosa TaxID=287 RepID=UPI00053D3089|nr:signal peptidase I [Pseudomonas aeruginosa]RUJ98510.1 signal peptidase I [Pseudomonas aeruginosa]HEH8604570.1 signal peptidase I [Pseudomonas aeruginosa]
MGLLAAIMLAVYLANPFGTASLDPRARLLGVALYKIPSRSMEPTLQQGDFILANAARYAFADPQVGDLVVFRFPPQRSIAYVKRIAGIPGDRVWIDGGRLYVNERPVTEPYLAQQALRQPDSLRMAERTVPAGQYFMLGDNRDNSNDSRYWGYVPRADLVGRVFAVWYAEDTRRIGSVR